MDNENETFYKVVSAIEDTADEGHLLTEQAAVSAQRYRKLLHLLIIGTVKIENLTSFTESQIRTLIK
jgi:hypothetical protein